MQAILCSPNAAASDLAAILLTNVVVLNPVGCTKDIQRQYVLPKDLLNHTSTTCFVCSGTFLGAWLSSTGTLFRDPFPGPRAGDRWLMTDDW